MTPEQQRERSRRYYAANREKCLAHDRAYREKNREKIRAQNRAWYEANKEEQQRKARERYRKRHGSIPMDEYKRELRMKAEGKRRRRAEKRTFLPPKPSAPPKGKCPPELLQAYSKADRNSIIRRKWPTKAAMVKHFEEGGTL